VFDGTSEMTMHNGIFRVSLVGATTLFRLTDTDGMDINNSVKLTAGDLSVEEGTLYVKNDGSLASIAVFRTLFNGAGYIEIQSRVANDGQIRFYDNVSYHWSIGLDLSPLAFALTNVEGPFNTATDILRLSGSSNQYLYSSSSVIFNLVARTLQSTFILQALTEGHDTMIGFKNASTNRFVVGHDWSDSLFKIIAAQSLSGSGAIEVTTDNIALVNGGGAPLGFDIAVPDDDVVQNVQTPDYPVAMITAKLVCTNSNPDDAIYDLDIDLDAIENGGESRVVALNLYMDASTAYSANLRCALRNSSNADIIQKQVVDGETVGEWFIELLWSEPDQTWRIIRDTEIQTPA
jgi:hypothetical protein